jgi:hypothetical protein
MACYLGIVSRRSASGAVSPVFVIPLLRDIRFAPKVVAFGDENPQEKIQQESKSAEEEQK